MIKDVNIIIEYFNNMQPWKSIHDIPDIPIVEDSIYKEIIVPNLIRCGAIPKKNLIDGKTYKGICRNANFAVWHADKNKFIYKRNKFGYTYDEDINHFEDDDKYDLFIPVIF